MQARSVQGGQGGKYHTVKGQKSGSNNVVRCCRTQERRKWVVWMRTSQRSRRHTLHFVANHVVNVPASCSLRSSTFCHPSFTKREARACTWMKPVPSSIDQHAFQHVGETRREVQVSPRVVFFHPWTSKSLVFYLRRPRKVESNVEDPVVVDNTSMTEVERRLSIQLFYVFALTCRGKALQVVRRVPEGFGFEAWKLMCREFELRLPSPFQGMLQALLSPTRMDDPVQTIQQRESRVKVYEEQSGDKVSENIRLAVLQKYLCDGELARHLNLQSARLTTYALARKEAINHLRAKQTWTARGGSDPMDLSPLGKGKGGKKGKGKGKGDKSAKPKECFYCGKPRHNKNECRNFSVALRKKSVQSDKAGRYAGVEVDPETGKRKPSGKGTGAVSPGVWMPASSTKTTVIRMRTCSHCPWLTRVTTVPKI